MKPSDQIQEFLNLLWAAQLYKVDNGPFISQMTYAEVTDDLDNEIVYFSWTTDEGDFSVKLTGRSIVEGHWDEDGRFICIDSEDEPTIIEAFKTERMAPSINPLTTIMSDYQSKGYCIVAWTPEEMGDTPVRRLEDFVISKGNEYLEDDKS